MSCGKKEVGRAFVFATQASLGISTYESIFEIFSTCSSVGIVGKKNQQATPPPPPSPVFDHRLVG